MDKAQAEAKLKEYGQEHVLKYYDELDEGAQEALLTQIMETDFSVLSHIGEAGKGDERGACRWGRVLGQIRCGKRSEITGQRQNRST